MENRRSGFRRFGVGMAIYALVFLLIGAGGLYVFWQYLACYENSRPKLAVNAYMDALTPERICQESGEVIDRIDHNLESREACRAFLLSQLDGKLSYAKKSGECTDSRQVYTVRCGSQPVGQFSIVTTQPDRFGFTPWRLEEDAYDLSYLIGEPESLTVPDALEVWVNGTALDSGYITQDNIPYKELEGYAQEYDLPHQVTYTYGPFLGEPEVSIRDGAGQEVALTDETDRSPYFHNCTEEEGLELDAVTRRFIDRYVTFTGSANRASMANFYSLKTCVVPGGDLEDRMVNALDGLQYAQSYGDQLASLTTHHQVRLAEGRYLCDVSYELDTTGHNGTVRTQTNMQLVFVRAGAELLVERLTTY